VIILAWELYCFTTRRGANIIREWLVDNRVTKAQIARFQERIDAFEQGGPDLVPGFITETPVGKDIYKVKIKATGPGWVQLRPFGCYGPFADREFTLLHGWIERNSQKVPNDEIQLAREKQSVLKLDRNRRIRERLAG